MHSGLLDSPFAGHYTDKGLLPVPAATQDRDRWAKKYKDRLDPGPRVVIPPPPEPEMLKFEPYSTDTDFEVEHPPYFDPMGVGAYQFFQSPQAAIVGKLMSLFGLKGAGTFMGLAGMHAEARAVDLAHERFGLEAVGFFDSYQRDFQPEVEYAGLPGVDPTWSETPSPDAMTAEEHAATQYGYFPTEDEAEYTLGHPDFEMPIGYELVDREEALGGPYTRPKNALYDEDQLQHMANVTGTIGNLGTETGSVLRGMPDMTKLGWDPVNTEFAIYTALYAEAVEKSIQLGTPHPQDTILGIPGFLDKKLQQEAADHPGVTGEWDPKTEPMMVDVIDDLTGAITGQVSTADLNWNYTSNRPSIGDPELGSGYYDRLAAREAREAMTPEARDRKDFEESLLPNTEVSFSWDDFEDWSDPDDLGDPW